MEQIKKILSLIFFISTFFSCNFSNNKEVDILFYDYNQRIFYETYFEWKNIKYTDGDIFITKIIPNNDLLKNLLRVEKLKLDIIQHNIVNIKTTRTAEGGPYRRKYVDISLENGIEIKEDTETNGWFKWDPTHPDSIKDGPNKGFVQYPNVYLEHEYFNLNSSFLFFNSIVDYIQRNNLNIIAEKLPVNSIEELKYYIDIDYINEYLKKKEIEEIISNVRN
jgi:flagellar basal-body rod protein FlgC